MNPRTPVGHEPRGFRAVGTFLEFDEFKQATVMPPSDVALVEQLRPNYIATRLTWWSATIMARLRKRYPKGFVSPYPHALKNWILAIVTVEAYEARGWNPSDAQSKDILDAATNAHAEVKEAADGVAGLFDLPISATDDTTAITAPAPLAYTETDPFTWMDVQRDAYRGR
jgi:hypothetical protein